MFGGERRPSGALRRPFGVPAGATIAVACLAVLCVVGASAAPTLGRFWGTAWSPSLYKSLQGCAKGNAFLPKWSKVTGAGSWHASAAAKTCGPARGGNSYPSYANIQAELQMEIPVHPPTGTGGVNVSWNMAVNAASSAGVTGSYYCPTQYYAYHYNWGYTWYNFTETYSYCAAQAEVFLYGFAYLVDQKTGASVYPSNSWSEPFNSSGVYNDSYQYSANYSNASYWSYNYSYAGSFNHSWGPTGALVGTFAPTWYINGSFVHAHQYLVHTYVYVYCYVSAQGYKAGKAAATVNMATGGNHWDLLPLSVW